MKKALYFAYVWPEHTSSAAGVRTREVIELLREQGYQLTALSPSQTNKFSALLETENVAVHTFSFNESGRDEWLRSLAPSLVCFDRFVTEEQFGWKIRDFFPDALTVIDSQDLHFVRRYRETLLRNRHSLPEIQSLHGWKPNEDSLRELAAFYRADLSLILSSWEHDFLVNRVGIPEHKLLYFPMYGRAESRVAPYSSRSGFAFLGNFRHTPNHDGVLWLARELWPEVLKKAPGAVLHLYGAYPPREISALSGAEGIEVHGPVDNHREALAKHRALIAPLRFGAGIKGKILEAWGTGTPVLGTALAFEGMIDPVPRECEFYDANTLIQRLTALNEESHWHERQVDACQALGRFAKEKVAPIFTNALAQLKKSDDLTGAMLKLSQHNSTKYFSRWIEEKNRGRAKDNP